MTNREWLESLSDEELAYTLNSPKCTYCAYNYRLENNTCNYRDLDCAGGIYTWLQSEHKDEE